MLETEPVAASAPCRIDMGGTLDIGALYTGLSPYFPATVNLALSLRTVVRLSPYAPGRIRVVSGGFSPVEEAADTAPFTPPVGLIFAVATCFGAGGVQIDIESASPPRSALGGSSAAATALVYALAECRRRRFQAPMPGAGETAWIAAEVEAGVAGGPCGIQDQLAAAFGGVSAWRRLIEPPGFERTVLAADDHYKVLNRRILVAYGGVPHTAVDVNRRWVTDFIAGKTRRQWREIANLSAAFAAALQKDDIKAAVSAMNRETEIRKQLTPDVLTETGDDLWAAARESHCGARFTGAGAGGCMWAYGDSRDIAALNSVWADRLAKTPGGRLLPAGIEAEGVRLEPAEPA